MVSLRAAMDRAESDGWSDWIRPGIDDGALCDGCYFDRNDADHARHFFSTYLRHSKGRRFDRKPFELMTWQWRCVIGPMFGWKRADGTRRFRTVYVEVPKKNGKSTLGAGVGLYLLVGDGEPGAEVYSAATKRDQASIVHGEAVNMFTASPFLAKRLRLNKTSKTISFDKLRSKYAALSADAGGSEGLNIHGLIIDELHVWKDRDFWDSLKYGGVMRDQPMTMIITTAGEYNKTSVGWREHEYSEQVSTGDIRDDDRLVYISCADMSDDWTDPAIHRKANPSYGELIDSVEMGKAAQRVKDKPVDLNKFLRYRLNIWTDKLDTVIDMVAWDECAEDFNEDDFIGRKCYAGLDLASKNDVAGFVIVFPPDGDDVKWTILPRLFVPRDNASKRERSDNVPYVSWGAEGHVTMTPSTCIDYDCIRRQMLADGKKFGIVDIGADPWNLEYLRQQLPDVDIIEYAQNPRNFATPTKEFVDVLIPERKIRHNGNPMLRWMAGNLTLKIDANDNVRPDKHRSKDKIDGIVACIMAVGRAMVSDGGKQSVYATRGILTV